MAGSPSARQALVALAVEAPPDADERVAVPLLGHRRAVGVPGLDHGVRRQLHQRAHDRVLQRLVGGVPGRTHAADRVAEQRVAGEDRRAATGEAARARGCATPRRGARLADEEGEHARGVARGVQRAHLRAAERERLAGLDRARRALDELALERMDEHAQVRPAREQRGSSIDVIVVMVGQQHMGGVQSLRIRGGDERLHRTAGVNEEGGPTLPVGHQIGVREELRVHRALDDHGAILARADVAGPPRVRSHGARTAAVPRA